MHQCRACARPAGKIIAMLSSHMFSRGSSEPARRAVCPRPVRDLRQRLWCGPAALVVTLLGAGPAWAGCNDAPAPGVDWTQCEKPRLLLRAANLTGAQLAGADFNGTDLQNAKLVGADLTHASVDRARLSGADLSRAKLVQLNAYRANMSGAVLVGADLTKAEMARVNLSGADLSRANLRNAEFPRANLEGAKLAGANLSGADLARTNLAKAQLDGARMQQARTFRTRLEGVNLSGVTGLTAAQLESACGNAATRLPDGLKMPKTWPCGKED
jgi:uncharacterized protein YjbI with pentapeptide repeats